MIRHYAKKRLINNSLVSLDLMDSSIWNLEPYQVAKLGGELAQVMLNAVEQHIYKKCLNRQQQIFRTAAFSVNQNNNGNHESRNIN